MQQGANRQLSISIAFTASRTENQINLVSTDYGIDNTNDNANGREQSRNVCHIVAFP